MTTDQQGLELSTHPAAAKALDLGVAAWLKMQTSSLQLVGEALREAPRFALAHAFKGCVLLQGSSRALIPAAREALAAARSGLAGVSSREAAHVAALECWAAGDLERALAIWEQILAAHPLDVIAFRLAHFNYFWLGRREAMRASVDRVLPYWDPALPLYSGILACKAFADEECGHYAQAESAGRASVALDPAELWGTHAVAHVLEMQGRAEDGIAWLDAQECHWTGGNNFVHHLWWHRAMFHFERAEFDAVLSLYDRRFRNPDSPLMQAMPDLYIDVQNAASMLFRLALHGIPVGARWEELADKAEARIGDCVSAFTLPHWAMALGATGRVEAARRMTDAMRLHAQSGAGNARDVGEVALPAVEAVLAHARGEYGCAVEIMMPALGALYRLGGSHAQQDVLYQVYFDAARRGGLGAAAEAVVGRAVAPGTMPWRERFGYRRFQPASPRAG